MACESTVWNCIKPLHDKNLDYQTSGRIFGVRRKSPFIKTSLRLYVWGEWFSALPYLTPFSAFEHHVMAELSDTDWKPSGSLHHEHHQASLRASVPLACLSNISSLCRRIEYLFCYIWINVILFAKSSLFVALCFYWRHLCCRLAHDPCSRLRDSPVLSAVHWFIFFLAATKGAQDAQSYFRPVVAVFSVTSSNGNCSPV